MRKVLNVTCYMLHVTFFPMLCLFLISVDSFCYFLMWLTVVLLKKLTVILTFLPPPLRLNMH